MRVSKLVVVLYVVIGVIVAAQNDYFENLDAIKRVISMLLAIALWPLILAGVDLRLR
ncbi:MAG: hypothetical protein ACRDOS_01675 [Gaiellaceae bacterium]